MISAFIPVRCGSKSIKWKNIKTFCGKPLIYWNLKALEDSELVDEIIVASDCDEIIAVVDSLNFNKVKYFKRNKINATDEASTESVILEYIKDRRPNVDDVFILVQATSPLTESKDFNGALEIFKASKSESLLTCVRMKRFLWNENSEPLNYDYLRRPRRQEFNGVLVENGAFYISTVGNIIKHENRIGGKISIYEMEDYKSIEIDEEIDWELAEYLMMTRLKKKSSIFSEVKLFLSDVDGTLTDAGMYYSSSGVEMKKFNTRDGKGFELLKRSGIKTGLITSEKSDIVSNRAKKLNIDYLYQGVENKGKLEVALEICDQMGISIDQVAYIGDDLNCFELLSKVGVCACPADAVAPIKTIPGIKIMSNKGGSGCVREFVESILK